MVNFIGAAACAGTSKMDNYDFYGRNGKWTNGLNKYLNPSACEFNIYDDGYDPNTPTLPDDAGIVGISSPNGPYCIDNFDPEITLRNFGTNNLTSVTINYNIDGGMNYTYPGVMDR